MGSEKNFTFLFKEKNKGLVLLLALPPAMLAIMALYMASTGQESLHGNIPESSAGKISVGGNESSGNGEMSDTAGTSSHESTSGFFESETEKHSESGGNYDREETEPGGHIKDVNENYIPLGMRDLKGEGIISETCGFFKKRLPILREAMNNSNFYFAERLLDESTGTLAFILAQDGNYAANLNGYFYYLFEDSQLSVSVSPLVLNISTLFDEQYRKKVFDEGVYAQKEHLNALEKSLEALLGEHYSEDVFHFIYEGYKTVFKNRVEGKIAGFSVREYKKDGIEIVFHDSFLTYIEFYIVG